MANAPFFKDNDKPFAQRYDTMSMDVVRNKDIPQGKMMYVKDESLSLKTDDLHKARPHYEHLRFLNKPDLSTGCTDPEHAGGRARTYYPAMDRRPRDLSLTTADIDYAQPKASSWKGNRHTDPVNPNYELPSSIKREPTPPRWNGRHTHDITDIEHTSSKVLHPERNYCRDPNDSRDIEHSTASQRLHRLAGQPVREDRALDVKDINGQKKVQARCTNPLEPSYKVSTAKTTSLHTRFSEERGSGIEAPICEPDHHGEVKGSKPRKLQWDNGEPQFSLMREDIAGTVPQRWVGSVPQNIYDSHEVRPMISFHDPSDIPGAQVGTLKKGMQTRREVNPLNPRYGLLDGDQKPPNMPHFASGQLPPPAGGGLHPLQRSKTTTGSLPILRGAVGQEPGPPSGRQGGYEPSWSQGGRTPQRTPSGSSGRLLQQTGHNATLKLDCPQPGEMSRRSSSAAQLSNRSGRPY